jgi:transcription-repair coupling factor (superfamily II helicase)
VDFRAVSAVCAGPAFKGRAMFSAGDTPYITCRLKSGESPLRAAEKLVEAYSEEQSKNEKIQSIADPQK